MNDVSDMINILVKERNQALAEKERQINYYMQKYNDSQSQLQNTLNQLGYKENKINSLKNQLDSIQSQLTYKENQLYNTQNQLQSTQNSLSDIQNQLQLSQNQLQSTQNQLQSSQKSIQNEKNSNEHLLKQLTEYQQKVSKQESMINFYKTELTNIRAKTEVNNNKIVSLMNEGKQKDEEINKLNSIIKIIESGDKINNPLTIYFCSKDSSINEEIVCHYIDLFSIVEEKLYEKNPLLKNTENIFLCNGKKIDENKTILYNLMYDKATILIVTNN